jgi:hypothetical protein
MVSTDRRANRRKQLLLYHLIKKILLYITGFVVGIVVFMGVGIAAGSAAASTFARVNGTDVSKLRQAGVIGGLIPTGIFYALYTVFNFSRSRVANLIIFIIILPIAAFGTSISLTLAVNKYLVGQSKKLLELFWTTPGLPKF